MTDTIRFWGVRGSIPTPGPATAGVGGNTSCVEVQLGGERIILDGGSGLRRLGLACGGAALRAHVLFGHLHWDHIQGVPFFGPLFHPDSRLHLMGPRGLHEALAAQMSPPSFPVGMQAFSARLSFETIAAGCRFEIGSVDVRTAPLRHPGGCIGYRLEHGGRAVVYACDTEHPAEGFDEPLLELASAADVLIYDAQYTPDEYPRRVGWGHSTFERGAALACCVGARTLLLSHHDPARTDEAVGALEREARERFSGARAAREGLVLPLPPARAIHAPLPDGDQPSLAPPVHPA